MKTHLERVAETQAKIHSATEQADEDGALLTTYEGQYKKLARAAACGLSRVT